jgi:hypothetical protein
MWQLTLEMMRAFEMDLTVSGEKRVVSAAGGVQSLPCSLTLACEGSLCEGKILN